MEVGDAILQVRMRQFTRIRVRILSTPNYTHL